MLINSGMNVDYMITHNVRESTSILLNQANFSKKSEKFIMTRIKIRMVLGFVMPLESQVKPKQIHFLSE